MTFAELRELQRRLPAHYRELQQSHSAHARGRQEKMRCNPAGYALLNCMCVAALSVTPMVARDQHIRGTLHALSDAMSTFDPAAGAGHTRLIDACLDVLRAVPGQRGVESLPADCRELTEAASFFAATSSGEQLLGQHIFDVELWDDALEALAVAVTSADDAHALEAAAAVSASARYVLLGPAERRDAIEALDAVIGSDSFLASRCDALAAVRQRRRAKPASVADAFRAARQRRRKQDYVAVAPDPADDIAVIGALYACAVAELGPSVLQPLGFPPSKLGLRSLIASTRAAGSQRAAAALGRVWHAAIQPGPIIRVPSSSGGARTLVLVFSSLGWHGVVRAEYGGMLRTVGDGSLDVAHCLDTAQSWFTTDPLSGEFDGGSWWEAALSELCATYERVCVLGESMGASGALRFARHATTGGTVVALVPQIDIRDFEYSGRSDFTDAAKLAHRDAIVAACGETLANVVLHVGQDPPDLRQLSYLPAPLVDSERLKVVCHEVAGHALGAGLKAQDRLAKTVLRDLLGHTYRLPAAGESSAWSGAARERPAGAAAAAMTGGSSATAAAAPPPVPAPAAAAAPTADPDVVRLADGSFYNTRLGAPSVWEIELDHTLIDEAASLFLRSSRGGSDGGGRPGGYALQPPFASVTDMAEPYQDIQTQAGAFFAQRVTWDSNIAWVSADDRLAFDVFESLFRKFGLHETFASVVPHDETLRMYSAFYVVRTWCNSHNFHHDYLPGAGTDALTLITPLADYEETDSFQLSYRAKPAGGARSGDASNAGPGGGEGVRRYVYRKGRAVVFGSGFDHSTEPGAGRDGAPHAYLCFTFGTDRQQQWPAIARTLGTQSRVVQHPDGEMRLTQLGEQLEEAVRAYAAAAGG